MNFSSLEYFTVLARERQFTRAAQALHITQQSLSAHISALEEELGCPLVVRHVPLELTYGGTVFLRYAQRILSEVRDMRREFGDITENQRGVLRVGVAFTRGRMLMPRIISRFQRQYPHIEVQLVEGTNQALRAHLQNGETDIAIADLAPAPGLQLCDFYEDEVVLLVPRALLSALPVPMEAVRRQLLAGDLSCLSALPFALGTPDDIVGRVEKTLLSRVKTAPPVRARSENLETLLGLCRQGAAACLCPMRFAKALLRPEDMAAIQIFHLGDEAKYAIRFGVLQSHYPWAILPEFIRIAKENF